MNLSKEIRKSGQYWLVIPDMYPQIHMLHGQSEFDSKERRFARAELNKVDDLIDTLEKRILNLEILGFEDKTQNVKMQRQILELKKAWHQKALPYEAKFDVRKSESSPLPSKPVDIKTEIFTPFIIGFKTKDLARSFARRAFSELYHHNLIDYLNEVQHGNADVRLFAEIKKDIIEYFNSDDAKEVLGKLHFSFNDNKIVSDTLRQQLARVSKTLNADSVFDELKRKHPRVNLPGLSSHAPNPTSATGSKLFLSSQIEADCATMNRRVAKGYTFVTLSKLNLIRLRQHTRKYKSKLIPQLLIRWQFK